MAFFRFRLAVKEQRCLAKMIHETFAACPNLPPVNPFFVRRKSALGNFSLKRATTSDRIRLVTYLSFIDLLAHMPVALVVVHGRNRTVNRNLMKIRAS